MATLGFLLDFYTNGALNIKYDKSVGIASIGTTNITEEQAAIICKQLGWTEHYLHPFEIIEKTAKFIKAFKTNFDTPSVLSEIAVDFQNKRSSVYGKTFDRIHVEYPRMFNLSILYGMAGNESPYVIYDTITSVPVKKCRNMKQVVEYINTRI